MHPTPSPPPGPVFCPKETSNPNILKSSTSVSTQHNSLIKINQVRLDKNTPCVIIDRIQ
jgi:hypothetical protein